MLDHVLNSCMIVLVPVVKDCQYSACTVHMPPAHAQLQRCQKLSPRPILSCDSDQSGCFHHRYMSLTAQYRSVMTLTQNGRHAHYIYHAHAIYSAIRIPYVSPQKVAELQWWHLKHATFKVFAGYITCMYKSVYASANFQVS